MPDDHGILLIGHGTRDSLGTQQFFQLADQLNELVSPLAVEPALLEFQQPTIDQAWQSLVERGVRHVHVAPLLLFAAGHAKQDIPEAIDRCLAATPAVTINQTRPLSRHRAIVDLVTSNLRQSIGQLESTQQPALVMVGRGNRDPCAQADMKLLSEIVGASLNLTTSLTGFYAMAEPKLTDVLEQVAASGRHDAILVHPHLLFAGRLHQAILDQTEQIASRYPNVEIKMAPYLGPHRAVAQAIAGRIHG